MSEPRSRSGNDSATFLALFALVLIACGLLLLTAVVIPFVRGIVVCLGGLVFVGVFHYLVWGWMMSKRRVEEQAEDTAEF